MQGDTITYRYFVAEGDEANALIADAKVMQASHFERIGKCTEKYGADCTWGGRQTAPIGVGFKVEGRHVKPPMKEGFLRPNIELSNGEYYAIYKPDKRYKAGKEIQKDLSAVGVFSFSNYVTKKIGVDQDCFGTLNGRMVLVGTGAGVYGDKLVVRVPVGGDSRPREIAIPPFMREIKKSEFIAITEE